MESPENSIEGQFPTQTTDPERSALKLRIPSGLCKKKGGTHGLTLKGVMLHHWPKSPQQNNKSLQTQSMQSLPVDSAE